MVRILHQGKETIASLSGETRFEKANNKLVSEDISTFAAGQTDFNTGVGFYLSNETGVALFSLGDPAGNSLTWDGESLSILGSISADSGTIGGWDIGETELVGTLDAVIRAGQTAFDTGQGFYIGIVDGDPVFSFGDSTGDKITWDSINGLVATGITATIADIGGFEVGADYVRDVADSFGLASTVTGDDDVRFWAGSAFTDRATAPFRVTEAGLVNASSIAITGGSITGSNMVSIDAVNLASRGWIQTCAFTSASADTVTWGSGTFTSANGDSFSISSGTTGVMVAKSYIYIDLNVSVTDYQVTDDPTDAVGDSKVLLAIAENNADGATFTLLDGTGRYIDASEIVANSITANELAASILYAGSLEVDTAGNIRSGQTAFNTGTGWFIGTPAGVAKFSIGNPSGDNMTWDGSLFKATGSISISSILNNATYLTASLPIAPTAVGFNVPGGNE